MPHPKQYHSVLTISSLQTLALHYIHSSKRKLLIVVISIILHIKHEFKIANPHHMWIFIFFKLLSPWELLFFGTCYIITSSYKFPFYFPFTYQYDQVHSMSSVMRIREGSHYASCKVSFLVGWGEICNEHFILLKLL